MNPALFHRLTGALLLAALAACSPKKDDTPAAPAARSAAPAPAPAAAAPAASSPAPAIPRKATLDCDDRTIVLEATCRNLYGPGLLSCSSQSLAFDERPGGASKSIRRFEAHPGGKDDPATVEEKIGALTCVKSPSGERHVVAEMFNGGNCPECEWVEVYDWDGKLVASDRDKSKPDALADSLSSAIDKGSDAVIGRTELDGFYRAPAQ